MTFLDWCSWHIDRKLGPNILKMEEKRKHFRKQSENLKTVILSMPTEASYRTMSDRGTESRYTFRIIHVVPTRMIVSLPPLIVS